MTSCSVLLNQTGKLHKSIIIYLRHINSLRCLDLLIWTHAMYEHTTIQKKQEEKCTCEIYNLRLNMCLEAMPKLLFSPLVRWWKFLGLGKPHVYYCSKLHSRDNLVNDNHLLHLLCATPNAFLLLMHCFIPHFM